MAASWIPLKDGDLLPFATNFSAKITATPTAYGLVAADATALATLVTTFTTALATANTPATRTKTTVGAKDVAKAQLVATMRVDAKRIQANPAVTVAQKLDLGLPIHSSTPTTVPPPTTLPLVSIAERGFRMHTIRLVDETTPTKKAKPHGVSGAEIYSFVPSTAEPTPPADLEDWRFEGIATKGDFNVDYRPDDVGKTAYIVARWYNPRGQPGPVSAPATGMVMAA